MEYDRRRKNCKPNGARLLLQAGLDTYDKLGPQA